MHFLVLHYYAFLLQYTFLYCNIVQYFHLFTFFVTGDFVIHNDKVPTANIALFAPLTPNDSKCNNYNFITCINTCVHAVVTEPCKRKGRRGSLLSTNASVYFNNHLKGTILQSLDIEEPSFMEVWRNAAVGLQSVIMHRDISMSIDIMQTS